MKVQPVMQAGDTYGFAVLAQRRMAIEELAATWDTSFDTEEKEEHEEGQS